MGPPITLTQDAQAAADALVQHGVRGGTWLAYGGSTGYFIDDVTSIPPADLQQRLLYIARSSQDARGVVAAITHMATLARTGTDWPAANTALLLGLLTHAEPHIASAAAGNVELFLKSDAAVSALVRDLCTLHTNAVVRAQACSAVLRRSASPSEDTEGLATVIRASDDVDPLVVQAALSMAVSMLFSTHIPQGTYDKLLVAATSSVPLIRANGISALAGYASNPAATAEQKARMTTLVIAALSDTDAWVRTAAISALGVLHGYAQSFDALKAKLDDPAAPSIAVPFRPLALDADVAALPQSWTTGTGSGFATNTVGTFVLFSLADWAASGDAGRLPPDKRLVRTNPADADVTRAELLAWWAANHDAAIAAAGH